MNDFRLKFDWETPRGVRGPELRATWARLEIAIGENVITRVADEKTRSVRDGIYLPLYPLAEWVAANWWSLLYEVQSPERMKDGYSSRHSLRAAAEGYALPELTIVPDGESSLLEWKPGAVPHASVKYLSGGRAYVEKTMLREQFRIFIESVLFRLDSTGVRKTFLHEEWDSICSLDNAEEKFCKAAGKLGLDPFAMSDPESAFLAKTVGSVPGPLVDEFLGAVDPEKLGEQTANLLAALTKLQSTRARNGLSGLRDLRANLSSPVERAEPWQQGYALAREVRKTLGSQDPISSVQSLGDMLKVSSADWAASILDPGLSGNLEGIVFVSSDSLPLFGLSKRHADARIFILCRALGEFLLSSSTALVSRTYSDRQKRNRAFAAEVLVPAATLRGMISGSLVTEDEIGDMAAELGTSEYVVRHQIHNHRLAKIEPSGGT